MILNGNCIDLMREMDANSVDAVVTDPPYGLSKEPDALEMLRHWLAGDDYQHSGGGFMGKTWDSFVPGPSVWREVLRVLKPGGHVLSCGGTRTYDLSVLAMRIAGFEIRDQLAWMYGTGFPKSLDVSKAIDSTDAAKARVERALRFTAWIRSVGLTAARIDEATGTNMGGHYTTAQSQPAVATREHFEKLRPLFGEAPAWVEQMVDERTVESENMRRREVIGPRTLPNGRPHEYGIGFGEGEGFASRAAPCAVTLAHTPEAQQWSGWGTALKPAQEPIVLARKPLIGTVAANVLAHGTGGINIDGCRIGTEGGQRGTGHRMRDDGTVENERIDLDTGRWPANVILDEVAAAVLDEQSGGASRFFYVAKASKSEREAGLDHLPVRSGGELTDREDGSDGLKSPRAGAGRGGGRRNHHPTVKPIELMRYLIRLITPPGGLVLDPFTGSGTTGIAAALEGFRFVGCELSPEYCEIARARIEHVEKKCG